MKCQTIHQLEQKTEEPIFEDIDLFIFQLT